MERSKGILIQISGSGKGCGKTSLVIRLLQCFPGAAYGKSALHFRAESPHGGDDIRCSRAGSSVVETFNSADIPKIRQFVLKNLEASRIVFLEKNSLDDQLPVDLFVFIDVDVLNPRDDRQFLVTRADKLITDNPVSEEQFLDLVTQIKKLCISDQDS